MENLEAWKESGWTYTFSMMIHQKAKPAKHFALFKTKIFSQQTENSASDNIITINKEEALILISLLGKVIKKEQYGQWQPVNLYAGNDQAFFLRKRHQRLDPEIVV